MDSVKPTPVWSKNEAPAGKNTAAALTTPECVTKRWLNLSDLQDKVCLDYAIQNDYGANSRGVKVEDRIVVNDYMNNEERNPHKSYGYLRTPEMAEIVDMFLTEGRSDYRHWLQRKLFTINKKLIKYKV